LKSCETSSAESSLLLQRLPTCKQVDDQLAKTCLREFIEQAWRVVEPRSFVPGWHIDLICDHLEAVFKGEIKRLLINIPPRHMKSLSVSVLWPAWCWLSDPGIRFLAASYAHSLSIRDSVKCRRLVQSEFYARLRRKFQPDFLLTGDVNNKIRFENNMGGVRIAASVEGALTGEGGDIIIVDDPHNVVEGESATQRQAVLEWWDYSMSTRLNNQKTGAYVVIMQRVHEDDLTGHLLAQSRGHWEHLCLPARYEGRKLVSTSLKKEDQRNEINQPLWPAQFGDAELLDLESQLGSYGSAGQLQQRPSPREGGMFRVRNLLRNRMLEIDKRMISSSIRYWDKAGSAGAGCYSAGVLIHELTDHTFLVADVVAGQWGALEREERIKATASMDGRSVRIWIEQEPGSGGKESAESTIRNLAGYIVKADRVTGDKVSRAEPFAAQVESGNVFVMDRPWTKDYIDELELFPNGKYKDKADASAGAFNKLVGRGRMIRPHVGSAPNADEVPDNYADLLARAASPEERKELEGLIHAYAAS
jgi:predicted phage terminase large subunit-like protein